MRSYTLRVHIEAKRTLEFEPMIGLYCVDNVVNVVSITRLGRRWKDGRNERRSDGCISHALCT